MSAACVGYCGYNVYRNSTPEGQRALAESHARDQADVDQFVQKLTRIRANLPTVVDAQSSCPPAAKDGSHPIVDGDWLAHVGRPRADWKPDEIRALAGVRDASFSEKLLLASATGDAGVQEFMGAPSDVRALTKKPFFAVLVAHDFSRPETVADSYAAGHFDGGVVLVDAASEKPICQVLISADSSDRISYGGGVRIKVAGIPTPAVGSKGLVEAVDKDFDDNMKKAVSEGLAKIGGR